MSNRKLEDDGIVRDLRYAREFLNDESHWCKGTSWRCEDGQELAAPPFARAVEDITSACIFGAVGLLRMINGDGNLPAATYIEGVWNDLGKRHSTAPSIAYWNDNIATHKDILEFLDGAIKHRETELILRVVSD